jgi:hypothetical protein
MYVCSEYFIDFLYNIINIVLLKLCFAVNSDLVQIECKS